MKKLTCPKCQTGLSEINYGKIILSACPKCSGNFLSRGHMKEADHYRFGDFSKLKAVRAAEPPVDCPACGVRMEKTKLPRKGKGLLDFCRGCESFWFDKGELDHFLVIKPPMREPNFIADMAAVFLFLVLLAGFHFILFLFFKSHLHAALFTFSIGPILFGWLIRMVIYGKILTRFGDVDV